MKKKLTAILAIVLVMGVVITACPTEAPAPTETPAPSEAPAPEIGKRAPDFQLNTLDGQSITLSELKGRPVLVNFWATWCGPCRGEMPYLQQIYQEWSVDELVVLTVNVAESSSQVADFMQSYELSFTVLLDSEAEVAQRYNVRGIPTTIFIDKDGIIQEIQLGAFRSQAEIETILSQLD